MPTALFAMPRSFDDQAGRAARFEAAGIGRVLSTVDDAGVADAVAWMERAPRPSIPAGGAERAAEALIDLVRRIPVTMGPQAAPNPGARRAPVAMGPQAAPNPRGRRAP